MDLALNNRQALICHKTQQTKPNQTINKTNPRKSLYKVKKTVHFQVFILVFLAELFILFLLIVDDNVWANVSY